MHGSMAKNTPWGPASYANELKRGTRLSPMTIGNTFKLPAARFELLGGLGAALGTQYGTMQPPYMHGPMAKTKD